MNKYISIFALSMGSILQAAAYTPAETNAVVEAVLDYLQQVYPDNWVTNFIEMADEEIPDTWINFLGGDETNGWTHAEKRAAFDWYLDSLGTTDCRQLSAIGKWRVRAALGQCDVLNYTNSWPYLKALALNPHGIHRDLAVALTIKFGPIDDAMTDFVEAIGTNVTVYGYEERGTYCFYQQRLSDIPDADAAAVAVRNRAVRRFYQHRFAPSVAGSVSRDFLFRDFLDGYAKSSDRLEFACFVLGSEEGRVNDGEYFRAITNQLISSGSRARP